MSANFEKVLKFYSRDLWPISRVRDAVTKGWITAEEYRQITGDPYE